MDKNPKWWQVILLCFIMPVLTGLTIKAFERRDIKIDKNDEVIKNKVDYPVFEGRVKELSGKDKELSDKIDTKLDKETFQLFLESWKGTQQDVRDIKLYLINKK